MKKITFSIVSHGQQNLVRNLIISIEKFVTLGENSLEIKIIENLENKMEIYSNKFVVNTKFNLRNKGFGSNHNSTFEQSDCDYFFVINPDVEITQPLEIDKIISYIEAKSIDIASPIIRNKAGDIEDYKRSDLTPWNILNRVLFKKQDNTFDWFAGVFLIIRSKKFRQLNGFDTKFYMYVEDCDLCMRAKMLGMKLGDISFVSVVHDARRSSFKNFQHLKWHISSLFKYWFGKYFC